MADKSLNPDPPIIFNPDQQIIIDGTSVVANGSMAPDPRSVESFSQRMNASIESAWNPKTETSFRGFVGAVVRVAKGG